MNVLIDLVKGLFLSLDIGTYIPPTCEPLCTFLGLFAGAEIPQESIKKIIVWLFWSISPRTMGLMILLGAYFLAYTLGHTSHPLAGLCVLFWVHLEVPKYRKAAKKNYFLIVLDAGEPDV
jgi:hypothetical protein